MALQPPQDTTPKKTAPAPAKPATPKPLTSMNPTQWADQVLSDLGINAAKDPNAVKDILSWMGNEEPANQWWGGPIGRGGTPTDPTHFNPLNTGGGSGYSGGAGGIGTYGNLDQAAQAVAQTLTNPANSGYGYASILQALISGADPAAFGKDVSASSWASGHYVGDQWSPTAMANGPAIQGAKFIGTDGGLNAGQQSADATAGAQGNLQNTQVAGEAGIAGANQQLSLQQLQQQYQNTLANLGLERTGLTEQQGYQTGQYGLEKALLALQEKYSTQGYGFEKQGDVLEQQKIQQALANLKSQYGYQTAGINQQTAASGVYNSGTRGQELGQAAQQYQYNTQQEQDALKQLGLQEQQQKAAYQEQQSQYGIQGKQQALTNTYQQQQLQNALARLGLTQQYAGQEFSTGQQGLYNDYLQNLYSIMQGQGQIYGGEVGNASQFLQNLVQSAPPTGG